MSSLTAGKRIRVPRRVAAGLAAAALAIAAPAALAASTTSHNVVHAQVQRSGAVLVTGYDGGAPLAP